MKCFYGLCFLPLDTAEPKFFGFAEFLVALAVMILAWTTADARYRFRIMTAPLPLRPITFIVVASLGVLTLLTDLWRAQGWYVPTGSLLSPAAWQGLLGAVFLSTFLMWIWFAFLKPRTFGPSNALVYGRALFTFILRGDRNELAVVADELSRSATALVFYAMNPPERPDILIPVKDAPAGRKGSDKPTITQLANEILSLVGDRKFCRICVASSPATPLALFEALGTTKAYHTSIGVFAKNIVVEALANRDSFAYHETAGYEAGLIGHLKPLSKAMFGSWLMVERIDMLFDTPYAERRELKAPQWEAYCRMVLITYLDYIQHGEGQHSYTMHRALDNIQHSVSGLGRINGQASGAWDTDEWGCLRAAMDFLSSALEMIDKRPIPTFVTRRYRGTRVYEDIYGQLARFAFEIITYASRVRAPVDLCWDVQRNTVWHTIFDRGRYDEAGGRLFKFRLRRLIYDELATLSRFPNFKNGPLLGLCLNVMGLTLNKDEGARETYALQKFVLTWTKQHFLRLCAERPKVAEVCLVDGIALDLPNSRLTKTYRDFFGEKTGPHRAHLSLDPYTPPLPAVAAAP